MPEKKSKITICMGSSCFSRGNNRHLQTLQQFLAQHGLEAEVELVGSRCEGLCMQGPNIRIDGELIPDLTEESLLVHLRTHFSIRG